MNKVKSMQKVMVRGQGSKVKVTEVKNPHNRFRTVIPVQFTYDDKMMHNAWSSIEEVPIVFQGHLSNHKVTYGTKNIDFDPNWELPDCNSS